MKFIIVTFLGLLVNNSQAQSQDSLGVISVTEKYIQAFYQGKPEWLKETLHPELVKRTLKSFPNSEKFIVTNGKSEMVELSRVFNTNEKFSDQSRAEIEVLDLFNDMASVKLTAEKWIDYLHLIKIDGKWQIVNVIWLMI